MALSKALREERDSLAQREGDLRWAWGDWAVRVAGPPGESTVNDGSTTTLETARFEDAHSDLTMLVPEVWRLQDYRTAAAAIPPKLRTTVRSIEAGKLLGRRVRDVRERHRLIQELTNEKGIVTADAVRRHFEIGETNTGQIERIRLGWPRSTEEKASEAARLLSDPKVAERAIREMTRRPSEAGRAIEKAVESTRRERAERSTKAREQRDEAKALPFPAHMAKMIIKIAEWAGELGYWYDELDTLPPTAERAQVGKTARELEHQARRWADKIEGIERREIEQDAPIESTAVDIKAARSRRKSA
jgi:hypothetical protein